MLDIGAKPLWVARQTGTSLEMIEKHYGRAKVIADELDGMIDDAAARAEKTRDVKVETRNLPGTFDERESDIDSEQRKSPDVIGASKRAGDRGRTGDVQLGKLAFYR